MPSNTVIQRNRHAFYSLRFILVVRTFLNQRILQNDVQNTLTNELARIFQAHSCIIVDYSFHQDYAIQIVFDAPPHKQLSVIVNNFKTISSRLLQKTYPTLLADSNEKKFWAQNYYLLTDTSIDIKDLFSTIFEE